MVAAGVLLAGRYRLITLRGEGGSASAWEAADLVSGERVLLKLLRTSSAGALFRAEFARLRELSHPHLVRVRDFGRAWLGARGRAHLPASAQPFETKQVGGERVPFFTSDLVEGETLRACCDRVGLAGSQQALRDALSALAFLHRLGLRHGDVKPENVLVDGAGRGTLIDLGCAAPAGAPAITGGTLGYLAPEITRGEPADQRADLYALGVMLRQLGARGALSDLAARLLHDDPQRRPSVIASALVEAGLDWNIEASPLGRTTPLLGRDGPLRIGQQLLARAAEAAPGARVLWVQGARGVGTSRFVRELCFSRNERFDVFECAVANDPLRSLLARVFGAPVSGSEGLVATLAEVAQRRPPTLLVLHDVDRGAEADRDELRLALGATPREGSLVWVVSSTGPPPRELGATRCEHLMLEPLTLAELEVWAGPLLPPSSLPSLLAHTGGFPRYVDRTLAAIACGTLAPRALSTAQGSSDPQLADARRALDGWLADLDGREQQALASAALGLPLEGEASVRLFERGLLRKDGAGTRLAREGDRELLLALLPGALVRRLSLRAAERDQQDASEPAVARRIAHFARAGEIRRALDLLRQSLPLARGAPRLFATSVEPLSEHMSVGELVLLASLFRQCGEPARALGVLSRARRRGGALALQALRLEAAECYLVLGKLRRAERMLNAARAANEPACCECRVRLCIRQGDYAAARKLAEQALPGCAEGTVRARLHEGLAVACSFLGDHDAARASFEQAEAADVELPPRVEARRWALQGFLAMRRMEPERALGAYERALASADARGFSDLVANALLNLASAHHMLGRYGTARELYARALRMARALGRGQSEQTIKANLANVALECGAFDEARRQLEALSASARQGGLAGALCRYRAELALLTDEPADALRVLAARDRGDGDDRNAREFCLLSAEAWLALGELEKAADALREPAVAARDLAPDLAARHQLAQGHVALGQGREQQARTHFEQALSDARGAGLPPWIARCEAALAAWYAHTGSPTLEREHRRRAESQWERMALDLPATERDAFMRHPWRKGALRREPGPPSQRSLTFVRIVELSRRINAQRTVDDVLRFALDAALELTSAERGFVLLYEARSQGFEVKAARPSAAIEGARSSFAWSRSIAERVITSGEPVITLDAAHDPRFRTQASVHAMGLKSVLCVPIHGAREVSGALYLDNRYLRARFTEADVALVQAFAEQVAVALGNALLLGELEQKQRELLRGQRKIQELLKGKEREVEVLTRALAEERALRGTRFSYEEIVGSSAVMQRLLSTLDRVIPTDLPVLVLGESGTGKELIARALHYQGPRAQGPFVTLNCGALPEPLLESELFGYVRGAFTGAERDKAGLMLAAHGGTLLLDELGELPLGLQVKLLRALTEREVRPVGATRSLAIDVRIVAATHRDLRKRMAEGLFREDLFYRLGVVELTLPPLRERREDILPIAERILSEHAKRSGGERKRLSREAAQALLAYPFPGNVRELQNVLLRASALCEDCVIGTTDLGLAEEAVPAAKTAPRTRADFEQEEAAQLLDVLSRERWNISAVSRRLGIPRNTLYRKLARLGLHPKGGAASP